MNLSTRATRTWAIAALLWPVAGCSLVPRSELSDCETLSRSLQTETSRLKDDALRLRASNRDLTQRALDDAQRIQALEDVNQRLEGSVIAYQEERERQAEALDQIRRQIRAAATVAPPSTLATASATGRDDGT